MPSLDQQVSPAPDVDRPLPAPARRSRPRRSSGRVHGILLLTTFLTTAFAGGLWWEQGIGQLAFARDLLDPGFLGSMITLGLPYAFWVIVILGCHEMGHYLACRYYGIPVSLPFFLPGIPPLGSFGAVIRIHGAIPHRRALFDIAAAGPIAGFLVTVPVLFAGMLRAEPFDFSGLEAGEAISLGSPVLMDVFDRIINHGTDIQVNSLIGAGWVGLLVTSLNLFPVGQLDGGHAVYAVSRRGHRILAWVTLFALAFVIVVQVIKYRQFPSYLIWFAILLWMRDRHPRLVDESTPLGVGRKSVAVLLLVIFALSFVFLPIYIP